VRILVTGGTGYLGSAIVHAIDRAGHVPVVFARHATSSQLPGERIDGDVRDTRAVTRAAESVGAICHTAAVVSVWQRDASVFDAVNVGGLQSALSAARTHAIPRLVYTSSFLALPPADSPHPLTANHYQRTKVVARDVARRAASDGLPVVCVYPGVIYGPGPVTEGNLVGRLMTDHMNGSLPGVIGADRPWSYAFVDDVADAHVAALTHASPAREYALGGVNAPQMAIFEHLQRTRGRKLPRRIPYAAATLVALIEEARTAAFEHTPLLTRGVVEIFRHDWSLDSEAARRDLSLRVTPLAEGLERTISSLRL
jgi:NAD+-dependent farnesol dehydrogenase